MDARGKLRQAQFNRGPESRETRIGELARQLVERSAIPARLVGVAEAVSALVDDEFRAHCRVERFSGGELVIQVDRADLLWEFGRRWPIDLRQGLSRRGRHGHVQKVTFVRGTTGVCIGQSTNR